MWKSIYNFITPILIVISIGFGIQQCNRANDVERKLANKAETFDRADEVLDSFRNNDGNLVLSSTPNLVPSNDLKSGAAPSTQKLVDSVAETLNLPSSKGRTTYSYTKVPISSSTSGKAKFKGDTAYLENDNWYLSYNYADSTLYGRYNTIYNQYDYGDKNTIFGVPFGKEKYVQDRWLNDLGGNIGVPKTVIIEQEPKESLIKLSAESKYRSMDNSVLSGASTEIGKGKFKVKGGYFYNYNTAKPEWEGGVKFDIFK